MQCPKDVDYVNMLDIGLSDASLDVHYSQLYDNCCLQDAVLNTGELSSAIETERRYFMSRLDDIVMRILFHQVPFHFLPRDTTHSAVMPQ